MSLTPLIRRYPVLGQGVVTLWSRRHRWAAPANWRRCGGAQYRQVGATSCPCRRAVGRTLTVRPRRAASPPL